MLTTAGFLRNWLLLGVANLYRVVDSTINVLSRFERLEHFMEQEFLAADTGARKEWAKKQGWDLLAIDDQR